MRYLTVMLNKKYDKAASNEPPPKKLDQKSNDLEGGFLWQNIAMNSRKKLYKHI